MPTVFAHETWFTDGPFPSDWSFAGETLSLALLTAALVVTLLVRLIASRFPGVDVPFLARLVPWMPFAVRMHLGVSLVEPGACHRNERRRLGHAVFEAGIQLRTTSCSRSSSGVLR